MPGTGGTYGLNFTASNGIWLERGSGLFAGHRAAPAITIADNTTFIEGVPGAFVWTTTGAPTPTLSESGILPAA